MTRPHSQISSMIKLYGQASASANKVDHERWQWKRVSRGGRKNDWPVPRKAPNACEALPPAFFAAMRC
jgi:hypothetical protein